MSKLVKYWPVIFIIGVWLIFAHPYFIKGLIPFPTRYLVDFFPPWNNFFGMPVKNNAMPDIITQIYPWKKIVIESLKMGQIPFWNPYQFAGNPHLANFQSAVFSPFNILFFILPFIDAWSLLVLLQPLLAGIFMYLFLRSLKRSKMGSLIGSIAFMFCGFIVGWMAYGTLAYAILYLPLMLYGIEKYFTKPAFSTAILISAVIPLSLFSGHFQTSLYFLLFSASYLIYKWFKSKKHKTFLFALLLFAIGIIVSLPQLLPTYHFYQQSVRSQLYQKGEVIPWQYMVTAFAPDFFGNPVTRNDWFGAYAEWGSFAGVIPLMLVLFSQSLKKRSASVNFFSIWILVTVLFVFITPFADLLAYAKIPVLSTSAFNRIIVLFSFAVSVLSSFGFDRLTAEWIGAENKKKTLVFLMGWFTAVSIVWLFILSKNLIFISNVDAKKVAIARSNFILPSLLFMVASVVWLYGYRKNRQVRHLLGVILVVLTVFDLLRFASKWMPFEERQYLYPEIPVLTYLSKNAGFKRVFGNIGNEGLAPFGLYGIEGYDPLYITRYGELASSIFDGIIKNPERSVVKIDKNGFNTKKLFDLLGVKFIFYSKGDQKNIWAFPFWQYENSFGSAVYSDEKYEIYENTRAYPRAFLVHNYQVATSNQEIVNLMFDGELDLSKTVVLEEKLDQEIKNCSENSDKVSIKQYTPNLIKVEAETKCEALLFLSDNYYSGWNAYVNNQKVKIYRADYSFRAIIVPKGISSIKFAYENWYL